MTASKSIPGPAYRIHTPRLIIRCMEPKDVTMLETAVEQSLEHLLPWTPWAKRELLQFQERIELLRQSRGNFDLGIDFEYGIFNPSGTCLLGVTRLHNCLDDGVMEIGYWIHKDHVNQGLATESSAALTKVAFEVDHVNRVEIHCDPKNVRSASVPRKLGFIHEATLHNRVQDAKGNLRDSMIWTLFSENYPASPAAESQIEAYDVLGRRIL